MGAENVQDGLTPPFSIFRQMEQFISPTQTYRVRCVSQVLNGIFQALLPLPLLGVLVGFRLFLRRLVCLRRLARSRLCALARL